MLYMGFFPCRQRQWLLERREKGKKDHHFEECWTSALTHRHVQWKTIPQSASTDRLFIFGLLLDFLHPYVHLLLQIMLFDDST